MFLTDRKLEKRIAELKEYRYREVQHLGEFLVREDVSGAVNPPLPAEFTGWERMRTGDTWKGRDRYLWLHREILVPAGWKGRRVVGLFDFGNTGGGNNSGFEAMLYLNGRMYQGVDGNHQEAFFDSALCGQTLDVTFRLWSGLEGGGVPTPQEHRIARADLAWLDEATDDFYYLASMVWQTVQELADADPVKQELRAALDRACRYIDWSYPGSDGFYGSVAEADEDLNRAIDGMDKKPLVEISCVGHTHIDVAWLWRLRHTREKCSRSFSTALRLMEQYPEFIFLQTQPQLYAFMKEEFPEIFSQIRERVREGRWEADGAMWVEADCNLTSGESLTRQILLGSKFFKEEFGREVEYLWLPDVFGYSWALPQILSKAGIHTFMTTKISWNQYNRMPHDTFFWKGIDGSEVLAHFVTTPEPERERGSWFYTYNGQMIPRTVLGTWEAYRDKQVSPNLLISYGYGDGGGGVNRDMLENRRRMDRIPGLPRVKTITAGAYFRKLQERVANTDQYVHTWDGELYLEYHRGTYTSQAYNKRMNRKMELLYREAEWLTAMAAIRRGALREARQEDLTEGWKHILTNQFHDIIPGSSIREVYEDSRKDYGWIASVAGEVRREALDCLLTEKEDCYTVFNASGWERDEIVAVPERREGVWRDGSGHRLLAQTAGAVTYVEVRQVPPMGAGEIIFEEGPFAPAGGKQEVSCAGIGQLSAAEGGQILSGESGQASFTENEQDSFTENGPDSFGKSRQVSFTETAGENPGFGEGEEHPPFLVRTQGRRAAAGEAAQGGMDGCDIETPFYLVSFNSQGQISRLYDREYDREILPEGACANVLQMFEDKPLDYDAWDIDIFYQEKLRTVTELAQFELAEWGPLQLALRLAWRYMDSAIRQEVIFYRNSRRIDFVTEVDWRERHQLLKAAFPVNIRSTYGTYDVQYGNVRRPNNWNTSWEQARFESVAHRWADLSERHYGVSLLNDCKYGHDIRDNVIRLSLLKAATHPDYRQDQGTHTFTYALLPHGGDFLEGRTVQEAYALNDPMKAWTGACELGYESFLRFDNPEVELDAVKKSEDGERLVVRFHEFAGSAQRVAMRPGFPFRTWRECDLRERPLGEKSEEKEIRLSLHAYEIKTVLIEV